MNTKEPGNPQKLPQKVKRARKQKSTPNVVDKFVIRLPQGLRDQIKALSEHNRRSMNSEIIMVLEQYIQQANKSGTDDMTSAEQHEVEVSPPTANLPMTEQELSEKLEALPPEKKEALLSLLT